MQENKAYLENEYVNRRIVQVGGVDMDKETKKAIIEMIAGGDDLDFVNTVYKVSKERIELEEAIKAFESGIQPPQR